MEKEQKPIVTAMMRTSFREPIEKTLNYYVMKYILRVMETVNIDGRKPSETEIPYIMETIVKRDYIKKELCRVLDELRCGDICAEVLKQYGMDKTSESTFMHDELMKVYKDVLCETKNEIMRR